MYNKKTPKATEDDLNNAMKRLTAGVQNPSENKVLESKFCGRCDKQILDPVVASVFNQTFHTYFRKNVKLNYYQLFFSRVKIFSCGLLYVHVLR